MPFPHILPAFVSAVSFYSLYAGVIDHAVLLKEGENCPRRNKIGNLAIKRARDRWCVTRCGVSELCSLQHTVTRPVPRQRGGERSWPLFFPGHVPTVHWSVCWIDETSWTVMPGLGLGWPCTFSPSTADPVTERAYYLLQRCAFKSDKIFTGRSAQQLTTILRPNSCLSAWEYIAGLANTLCKLAHQNAFTECSGQKYKSCYQKTGCWATDEQNRAKPWCKSLHRMKATSSGQISVENPISRKY